MFLATSPGPRGGASVLSHLVQIMPYRGAHIVGSHAVGSFQDKTVDNDLIGSDKEEIQALVAALESKVLA